MCAIVIFVVLGVSAIMLIFEPLVRWEQWARTRNEGEGIVVPS